MQDKYPTIQIFFTIIWFLFDIISRYNHQVEFFFFLKKRSIILIPILTIAKKKFSILIEIKTTLRVSLLGHGTGKDPRTTVQHSNHVDLSN